MYEDVISTILGDLQQPPSPGAARVNALRGQPGSFAEMSQPGPPGMPPPQPPMPQGPPSFAPNAPGGGVLPPGQAAGAPQGGPSPQGGATGSWGEPEPNTGGQSGSWGPPPGPPQPAPPPQPTGGLDMATGRSPQNGPGGAGSSSGGVGITVGAGAPGRPAPAGPDPLAAEYADIVRRQKEAEQQEQDLLKPVDRTEMERMYGRRAESGNSKLLLALAAQQAGEGYAPFQAQFLKQSAEAEAPMKVTGGTMTPQGFIPDADFEREKAIVRVQARLQSLANARAHVLTKQSDNELRRQQMESQEEMKRLMLGQTAAIANQSSADRRYAADLAHQDRQDRAGAGAKGAGSGKGTADPQTILNLLDRAEAHLGNATGSGAGALVDKGVGFFGGSTKGMVAAGPLKVIAGNLTMAQPRMEGPQSDKDTALYKEMAGNLADDTLPVNVRQSALKEMRLIANRYKSGYWAPPGYKPPPGFKVDSGTGSQTGGGGGQLPAGWSYNGSQ